MTTYNSIDQQRFISSVGPPVMVPTYLATRGIVTISGCWGVGSESERVSVGIQALVRAPTVDMSAPVAIG